MPSTTSVMLEYRCSRCWHSNCADINAVATQVACRNCGHENVVPEATPERIERAIALLESAPDICESAYAPSARAIDFDRPYSDQEMIEIARRESYVPLSQMNFAGYPKASALSRLIADVVDKLLLGVCIFLGVLMTVWIGKFVMGVANPLAALKEDDSEALQVLAMIGIIPMLFLIAQWCLVATSGQTLGKKLMMIRIVTDHGALPGFVRGVLLRSWVRMFLCWIPRFGYWFGLLDILFIFSPSGKCLHDHIAGTRVVSLM